MTSYESGLQTQLAAEIEAFPTTGLFRGQIISGMKGVSPLTQQLRAAGHYDKQEIDFTVVTPTGAPIATADQLTIGAAKYKVRETEYLEGDVGLRLVLSRLN